MHGVKPDRLYGFDFTLIGANNVTWASGPITASARRDAFGGAPYVGLVGRDILDQALFICNGPAHHCTLAF